MIKRKIQRIKKKSAESYVDVIVGFLLIILLFVFTINTFSTLFMKQDLDYVAKELAKTAAACGYCGRDVDFGSPDACVDETSKNALGKKLDKLLSDRALSKDRIRITWSVDDDASWFVDNEDVQWEYDPLSPGTLDVSRKAATNRKVQYGNKLRVTVEYDFSITGVGSDIFNGRKSASYAALSQVYWKTSPDESYDIDTFSESAFSYAGFPNSDDKLAQNLSAAVGVGRDTHYNPTLNIHTLPLPSGDDTGDGGGALGTETTRATYCVIQVIDYCYNKDNGDGIFDYSMQEDDTSKWTLFSSEEKGGFCKVDTYYRIISTSKNSESDYTTTIFKDTVKLKKAISEYPSSVLNSIPKNKIIINAMALNSDFDTNNQPERNAKWACVRAKEIFGNPPEVLYED